MQNTSIKQKKKILVQHLQQQFSTCRILQQYKISMHIKSCLSLMTEAIVNKWRPLSQKAYQKSAYIYHKRTDRKIMQDF